MLQIANLSVQFGGVLALNRVSFSVGSGQICGLIGPNGAGKTTLFNCLSRFYDANEGSISFDSTDLLALPAFAVAKCGIARTFQNLALFKTLTVRDNVKLGAAANLTAGYLAHALRLPKAKREEAFVDSAAREAVFQVGLEKDIDRPVSQLNFATQKKVELARALVGRPRLLLLDEPAGGLNHEEVGALGDLLRGLREKMRLSILVVEHHLNLVMQISDQVVALDFGCKIADGSPGEVSSDKAVIQAYLGTPD